MTYRLVRGLTTSAVQLNKVSKAAKSTKKIIKSIPRPEDLKPKPVNTLASSSKGLFETEPENIFVEVKVEPTVASSSTTASEISSSPPAPTQESTTPPTEESAAFPSPSQRKREKERYQGYEKAETIYTAEPSFSVPLVLTATFVASVFCLNAADMARVGYSTYDEEKQEYEIAPAWQRWGIATSFAAVGLGILTYGAIVPARIVTKLTMRRPIGSTTQFPSSALVAVHTPITKLPFLSEKEILLEKIILLGPLSNQPQHYHPQNQKLPPSDGFIRRLLRPLAEALIATPTKPKKSHWDKAKAGIPLPSHVPLLLVGDRASYSMAVRRGPTGLPNDPKGAWCSNWEGLERGLLGVKEV